MHSPYHFESRGAGNSKSRRLGLEGSLLRVEWPGELIGYADLRPHPGLGDLPISDQLKKIRQSCPSALAQRSLFFARADAEARNDGVSLFHGLESRLPQTHLAAGSLLEVAPETLDEAVSNGFSHVKLKVGIRPEEEARKLKSMFASQDLGIKLRLDFNGALSRMKFQEWISSIGELALHSIDFIEDPFGFQAEAWNQCMPGLLAIDRELSQENLALAPDSVAVFKPALMEPKLFAFRPSRRVVFTNYMDHPVGESFAVFAAAGFYKSFGNREICGLRTSHLFADNAYSEMIQSAGPELRIPEGHGIGFTELLETEDWKTF